LNINYFDALSNPQEENESTGTPVDRFMVAQAIMLSLQGMPGIYFHSLFGSRGDRVAAEESGIPRRINRAKLRREELERTLCDPTSLRARVFSRFKELLAVRQNEPAFNPTAGQQVLEADRRVFALLRQPTRGRVVLGIHNISKESFQVQVPVAAEKKWRNLFNQGVTYIPDSTGLNIQLAPYEVLWAGQE
jgi:sucrose phosphorylase